MIDTDLIECRQPRVAQLAVANPANPKKCGQMIEHTLPCSLYLRCFMLLGMIVPFAALILGIILLWGHGFRWTDFILLAVGYTATAMAVGLGYHRLLTHRAFDTHVPIKVALGIVGSMAAQGPILNWVATHRRHHQHSDDTHDPHSPHMFGEGMASMIRGYFHSHMGWFFDDDVFAIGHYVGDLKKDRAVCIVSALFPLWVALGLVIPAAIGGAVSGTWTGAFLGLLWGGLVRILLVHHLTWSINSACHIWGSQTFRSDDHSRNNAIFGVLAFGEGWHNNHHAFPTSARHGLRWWQFDANYLVIRTMERLGLAWNVRRPAPAAIAAKKRVC